MQIENEMPHVGDYKLSATEVADILWLASFLATPVPVAGPEALATPNGDSTAGEPDHDDAGESGDIGPERRGDTPSAPVEMSGRNAPEPVTPLYSGGATDGGEDSRDGWGGVGFKAPRAPAILEKAAMVRGLRPLQRRIPSTHHFRLHEAETAERIAAAAMGRGSWLPARYPMPERWLDLVILVDGAPSMALWQQTVDEFIALLANTGIFRNVQRWTLAVVERDGAVNDEYKTKLHLYPAQVAPGSTHRRHAATELLDQQQRRLFVVISDCSSIVWDSGAAQRLLQPLAAHNLVSLVQVLPEELWKTTALRLAEETRLMTSRALSTNAALVVGQGRRSMDLPIPVVSLEAESLHLWAGFLVGRERRSVVGYYLPVVADVTIDVEQALLALGITPQPPQETETTVVELYDRFRERVPQRARPMAAYFAAAPLTLPVMRMVQATMLPQTTHADFVRVFYSGLIRRQTAQTADYASSDMVYDFVGGDEMREFLLTRLPRYSAEQIVDLVIAELSRFVQEHLDQLYSFDAIMAVRGTQGVLSVNATAQHFADVTTKVLRYLGGVYAAMADNLEQFILPARPVNTRLEILSARKSQSEETDYKPPNTNYSLRGHDVEIPLEHVAGRDIVTSYHYYGTGAEQKDEDVARPLVLPDGLPEVGDLPAGSRVVHRYNRFFVGREEELKDLARLLQAGQTAAIGEVAGITGLGGVGKSQLAVALVYRYGRFFPGGVFWVSMANPEAIETEIARCGGLEGMNLHEDFASLELSMQVALVQREWQKPVPRLLIFDNCEDERLLEEYRPKVGGCRVIVTSRKGNWSRLSGVQNVPLDTLPRTESITLLRKHVPGGNLTDLDAIAAELGDLPLALHLAGSYLEQWEGAVTPQGYLQHIRTKGVRSLPALQGEGVDRSPTQHELSVWRTFEVSYAGLQVNDAVHRLAQQMIACAAWFQPGEPIPIWLLDAASSQMLAMANTAVGNEADVEIDEEEQLRLVQARRRLVGLGLVMRDGKETVTLHRLVGAYAQGTVGAEESRQAVEQVVFEESSRLNKAGYPAPLLVWQSHLRHVADEAIKSERELAAYLGNELGYHLQSVGDYTAARPYLERALAIREKALGPEHPDTATSLNNLGGLLRAMGEYAAARPTYEHALAIREKALGPEHPDTATSLNNLGFLLQGMGDDAAARPYYERALAIREKALGPEHPDTANSLNNLGGLLQAMGDYAAARPTYERALAIYEKALGPEHPDTAQSLNNLGALLSAMGDYAAARPTYERALAINEKALGPEHPDTATCLYNLGGLCFSEGDLPAAAAYLRQALLIREKRLGPNHPHTQQAKKNLAFVEEQL